MKTKEHLARGAPLRGLARRIRGKQVAPRDRERRRRDSRLTPESNSF